MLSDEFKARHRWLRELSDESGNQASGESRIDRISRFMDFDESIEGVPLRVEELCGTQGDVVIAHPGYCMPPRRMPARDLDS